MAIAYHKIKLDKEYRLRFGMGAMLRFENETGIKIADITANISIPICLKVIHAAIKSESPDVTIEELADLIDDYYGENMIELIGFVTKLINDAILGSPEKKPKTMAAKIPTQETK